MFTVWTDAHILNEIPTNQTEEHSKESIFITWSNYFHFRDLKVEQYIKMKDPLTIKMLMKVATE